MVTPARGNAQENSSPAHNRTNYPLAQLGDSSQFELLSGDRTVTEATISSGAAPDGEAGHWTTFSAGDFVVTGFVLISTSMWGQDEPKTFRYAIRPNCSVGADGGQLMALFAARLPTGEAATTSPPYCSVPSCPKRWPTGPLPLSSSSCSRLGPALCVTPVPSLFSWPRLR
jgi:hypothetical protein